MTIKQLLYVLFILPMIMSLCMGSQKEPIGLVSIDPNVIANYSTQNKNNIESQIKELSDKVIQQQELLNKNSADYLKGLSLLREDLIKKQEDALSVIQKVSGETMEASKTAIENSGQNLSFFNTAFMFVGLLLTIFSLFIGGSWYCFFKKARKIDQIYTELSKKAESLQSGLEPIKKDLKEIEDVLEKNELYDIKQQIKLLQLKIDIKTGDEDQLRIALSTVFNSLNKHDEYKIILVEALSGQLPPTIKKIILKKLDNCINPNDMLDDIIIKGIEKACKDKDDGVKNAALMIKKNHPVIGWEN